jgi:hypothetical protein
MGYRSDVSYYILFPAQEQFHVFVAQAKALSNQKVAEGENTNRRWWGDMASALAECEIGEFRTGVPIIAFYERNVKWYPTMIDVDNHESLLELATVFQGDKKSYFVAGTSMSASFTAIEFMRLGEDSNDTDHYTRGHHSAMTGYNLRIERRIDGMQSMYNKKLV